MTININYFTGSLKVDGVQVHNDAHFRLERMGEESIVHAHLYKEPCNEDCVEYKK